MSDSACRSQRLATSAIGDPNRNDRVSSRCPAGNPVITSLAERQAYICRAGSPTHTRRASWLRKISSSTRVGVLGQVEQHEIGGQDRPGQRPHLQVMVVFEPQLAGRRADVVPRP
jgi:hypothetical protein